MRYILERASNCRSWSLTGLQYILLYCDSEIWISVRLLIISYPHRRTELDLQHHGRTSSNSVSVVWRSYVATGGQLPLSRSGKSLTSVRTRQTIISRKDYHEDLKPTIVAVSLLLSSYRSLSYHMIRRMICRRHIIDTVDRRFAVARPPLFWTCVPRCTLFGQHYFKWHSSRERNNIKTKLENTWKSMINLCYG